MGRIRVVLADDHPIVLAGIRSLLNADPGVDVVGEATNGGEALPLIRSVAPDVAVLDVSMPGLNGLELTERVTAECPGTKVLVLTVHEDAAYVQPLLKAGARGYLLKRSAAEDLLRAVHAVARAASTSTRPSPDTPWGTVPRRRRGRSRPRPARRSAHGRRRRCGSSPRASATRRSRGASTSA